MAVIFIYLALLAVAFFFLIVRPQRRQMAARRALVAGSKWGTTSSPLGGSTGRSWRCRTPRSSSQIAPGIEITLAREAVSGIQVPPEPESDELDLRSDPDPSDPRVGDPELGESPTGERDPTAEDD